MDGKSLRVRGRGRDEARMVLRGRSVREGEGNDGKGPLEKLGVKRAKGVLKVTRRESDRQ